MLKNDICINEIGLAVPEIFEFKVNFPRKIPKIRDFANVSITQSRTIELMTYSMHFPE